MKHSKAFGIMALALLAVVLIATPSFADSVTLANANLTVDQGGTVTFFGTYTGDDISSGSIHWTGASPCLDPLQTDACVDYTGFVLASPGVQSNFFDIFVDSSIATGTYYGSFLLFDGNGDFQQVSTDFSVTVATPEPGSLMLLGTGLVGAAGALRRKILG